MKHANEKVSNEWKKTFLELLLYSRVLQFGEFKTKSGRTTPYFFNTGNFSSGRTIGSVAACYAQLISKEFGGKVTNLFGPAYKGIPLCVAASQSLAALLDRDIGFTFNRKEQKDHGEGGSLIGASYSEPHQVVVIEDVLTGGTSLRETMHLMRGFPVKVIGCAIGVDRQERGLGEKRAAIEIEKEFNVPVRAILTLDEIVDLLFEREVLGKIWVNADAKKRIDAYRAEYGA